MQHVNAIGFDLFNTLITLKPPTLNAAMDRMTHRLRDKGFHIEGPLFIDAYEKAVLEHLEKSRKNGRETHNRYWISSALQTMGYSVSPHDPIISEAVEAYFSTFFHGCDLIPDTLETLEVVRKKYRLGLLTNFTHPPVVRKIIHGLGLEPFFEGVLISGELGYRKPHPSVFDNLIDLFGLKGHQILYVGDDPEPDILGAQKAGLQPVWTTCVRDQKIPAARGLFSKEDDGPGFQVPRFSKWEDFLNLLDLA